MTALHLDVGGVHRDGLGYGLWQAIGLGANDCISLQRLREQGQPLNQRIGFYSVARGAQIQAQSWPCCALVALGVSDTLVLLGDLGDQSRFEHMSVHSVFGFWPVIKKRLTSCHKLYALTACKHRPIA